MLIFARIACLHHPNHLTCHYQAASGGSSLPLEATWPPFAHYGLPGASATAQHSSVLGGGANPAASPAQESNGTRPPPPWPHGAACWTNVLVIPAPGNPALGFSLCFPSAQQGSPLAAANSFQAVPRGMGVRLSGRMLLPFSSSKS